MQKLTPMSFNRTSSLSRSSSRPGQNESLLHANRVSLSHMGKCADASQDPKGRHLRQLRLNKEIDPAELATQACISLAQLYEIEQGLSSRFYSPALREQAARRVAKLLDADWDHLGEMALPNKPATTIFERPWPLSIDTTSPSTVDEPLPSMVDPKSMVLPALDQPIALGLSTPCTEPDESLSQANALALQKARRANRSRWLMGSLVLLLAGGLAYGLSDWNPYVLDWPWNLNWPTSLTKAFAR